MLAGGGLHEMPTATITKRTIAAIKLNRVHESWYARPPYAVAEMAIDEDVFEG
jgi:hypothetical protein